MFVNKSLLLVLVIFLSQSQAYSFSKIVFFGDSLSDSGNACPLGQEKNRAFCALYPGERFTHKDSLVWAEHFVAEFGLDLRPSRLKGDNFAFGGATSGLGSLETPGVLTQIEGYLKRSRGHADPDAIYVIWVGGNDVKNQAIPLDLLNNIKIGVERLTKRGARNFIVPNLLPIHETPITKWAVSAVASVSKYFYDWHQKDSSLQHSDVTSALDNIFEKGVIFYNRRLDKMLHTLEKDGHTRICKPDMFAFFKAVSQNPKKYGLVSTEDLFYVDFFHPSAAAHKIIAVAIAKECSIEFSSLSSS